MSEPKPLQLSILILFCFFVSLRTYSQTVSMVGQDSLLNQQINILDSITAKTSKSYSSLKYQYDTIEQKYNSLISKLTWNVDSLLSNNIPSNQYLQKIDSVSQLKQAKLSLIKNNFDSLKINTINRISILHLPPELKGKVDEYTSAINKLDFSLPSADFQLPSLDLPTTSDLTLPSLNNSLPGDLPNLPTANIPAVDEIKNSTSQLQGLNQSVPKDIPTIDQLGETAETQVGKIGEISAVQDQMGNLPTAPITSEEQAKQELLKQAKEAATDHFAGKEQELKSAMDQISKYKKKFHNVNNLEELAALIKKRPNEMRGKPFIERLIPGIAFQLQKKDDLLFLDFNPYFSYRFTGRFTSGIGWNQRVFYDLSDNSFQNDSRIFGPRVYSEYKLWRGFSPRIEVEAMNTFVPPYIKVSPADVGQREWVWGVFVGIKKDYKFWKKINGTAQVMFRLFDPDRKSPYADVLNARFGFEFPMKKKEKKTS
jgi:hypothetical protein